MTEVERKRAKKRKKMARNVRRFVKNVLLMPGKFPPIDEKTVENAMKACETFGVLFVGTLIAHLISESSAVSIVNIIMRNDNCLLNWVKTQIMSYHRISGNAFTFPFLYRN